MYLEDAIKFQEKYSSCPKCGSNKVSEGSMSLTGGIFERTCKCGFSIKIDVNEKGDRQ